MSDTSAEVEASAIRMFLEDVFVTRMTFETSPARFSGQQWKPFLSPFFSDDQLPIFWGDLSPKIQWGNPIALYCHLDDLELPEVKTAWFAERFGVNPSTAIAFGQHVGWSASDFVRSILHEVGHNRCHRSGCACYNSSSVSDKITSETHADEHMIRQLIVAGDKDMLFGAMMSIIAHLRRPPKKGEQNKIESSILYYEAAKATVARDTFNAAKATFAEYDIDFDLSVSRYGRLPPTAKKEYLTSVGRLDFDKLGRLAC